MPAYIALIDNVGVQGNTPDEAIQKLYSMSKRTVNRLIQINEDGSEIDVPLIFKGIENAQEDSRN